MPETKPKYNNSLFAPKIKPKQKLSPEKEQSIFREGLQKNLQVIDATLIADEFLKKHGDKNSTRETNANDLQNAPDYQFASANDNLNPAPIEDRQGTAIEPRQETTATMYEQANKNAQQGTIDGIEPQTVQQYQNTPNLREVIPSEDNTSKVLNTVGITDETQKQTKEVYNSIRDNFNSVQNDFDNGNVGTGTLKLLNTAFETVSAPFPVVDAVLKQNPSTKLLSDGVNYLFENADKLMELGIDLEKGATKEVLKTLGINSEFLDSEGMNEFNKLRKNIALIIGGEAGIKGFKTGLKPLANKLGIDTSPAPIKQVKTEIEKLRTVTEEGKFNGRDLNMQEMTELMNEISTREKFIKQYNETFVKPKEEVNQKKEIDLSEPLGKSLYENEISTYKDFDKVEGTILKGDKYGEVYTTKTPEEWQSQLNYEANKDVANHLYLTVVKDGLSKRNGWTTYGHESVNPEGNVKIVKYLGDAKSLAYEGKDSVYNGNIDYLRQQYAKENNIPLENVEVHWSKEEIPLAKTTSPKNTVENKPVEVEKPIIENLTNIDKTEIVKPLDKLELSKQVESVDKDLAEVIKNGDLTVEELKVIQESLPKEVVNPQIQKLTKQKELLQKKYDENKQTSNKNEMPGTYITGRDGVPKSRLKKLERQLDKTIDNAVSQKNLKTEIDRVEGRIQREVNKPKVLDVKLQTQKVDEILFSKIKEGDIVDVGGNNKIKVAKKNSKSIVSENGAKYNYNEIVYPRNEIQSAIREIKSKEVVANDLQKGEVQEVPKDLMDLYNSITNNGERRPTAYEERFRFDNYKYFKADGEPNARFYQQVNQARPNGAFKEFQKYLAKKSELFDIGETARLERIKQQESNIKPESYNEAVKNIRNRGSQLNSNPFDPTVFKDIYTIGKFHLESGLKNFTEWGRKLIADVGSWIKPHLQKLWTEINKDRTGLKDVRQNLFGGINAKGFEKAKGEGKTFENPYDKKTRFEIDDSKAKLKWENGDSVKKELEDIFSKFHDTRKFYDSDYYNVQKMTWDKYQEMLSNRISEINGEQIKKLPDILDYKELYKNYPELKDVNVEVRYPEESAFSQTTRSGGYDDKTNTIYLSRKLSGDRIKSTLLHELQHNIQSIENFARGGNQGEFKTIKKNGVELFPIDQYRALAGEIEARDVQARMNLTRQGRAKTQPYTSENVNPKDAIVKYDAKISALEEAKKSDFEKILDMMKEKKIIDETKANEIKLKMRGTAKRMSESPEFKDIADQIKADPESYYEQQNITSSKEALEKLSDAELVEKMKDTDLPLQDSETNVGILARLEAFNRARLRGEDTSAMLRDLYKQGTSMGQLIRQFAELKTSTKEGLVALFEKRLDKEGYSINENQRKNLIGLADNFLKADKNLRQKFTEYEVTPTTEILKEVKRLENIKNREEQNLGKKFGDLTPRSLADTFIGIIQGNLLTPMSQVTNIWGNLFKAPLQFSNKVVGTTADLLNYAIRNKALGNKKVVRSTTVNPRVVVEYFKGFGEGFVQSLKDIAKGDNDINLEKFEIKRGFRPLRAWVDLFSKDMPTKNGKIPIKDYVNKISEGLLGIPPEIMFRLLNVGDKPFRTAMQRATVTELGQVKGLKGGELNKFKLSPDKKAQGIIRKESERSVFAQDNKFADWFNGLFTLAGKIPQVGGFIKFMGKVNFPYTKFPLNYLTEVVDYVAPPISLAKALHYAKNGETRLAQEHLGKTVTGLMIYSTAKLLSDNGIISGDSDDKGKVRNFEYSTKPSNSINLSALKRFINGEPTAWKSGDEIVDYNKMGIFGAVFNVHANTKERNDTKKPEERNVLSDIMGMLPTASQYAINQSFLKGTSSALDALQDKTGNKIDKWIENMFNVVASVPLPNTLNAVQRSREEYLPQTKGDTMTETLGNVIKAKTFNTGDLPIRVNMWGNKIKRTPEGANPIAYQLFDVSKYKNIEDDKVTQELYKIYTETNNAEVLPPEIGSSITEKKTTYKLNVRDKIELETLIGQERRKNIEAVLNSQEYKDADEEKLIYKIKE